jgi:hypothetical protein
LIRPARTVASFFLKSTWQAADLRSALTARLEESTDKFDAHDDAKRIRERPRRSQELLEAMGLGKAREREPEMPSRMSGEIFMIVASCGIKPDSSRHRSSTPRR